MMKAFCYTCGRDVLMQEKTECEQCSPQTHAKKILPWLGIFCLVVIICGILIKSIQLYAMDQQNAQGMKLYLQSVSSNQK